MNRYTTRYAHPRRCADILKLAILCLITACASSPQSGITLKPVPKAEPPDPVALSHFVDARLYELRGQPERAVASLRAALAIDTTSATLYGVLARNLAAQDRYADAADPARRSLDRDPNNLDVRWLYYESLLRGTGDTTAALAQLEVIVRNDPDPIKAFDQMLKVHDARDDNAAVIRTLDRIVTLPDLSERATLIAAQNYQQRGANAKAERLITDVLERNPTRSDAWVRLASLQVARNDTLASARSLRAALANQNGQVNTRPIWRQLVNFYIPKSRMDSLLAESPPDTAFQEQLAEVFRTVANAGNPQQAVHLLERSVFLFNNLTRLRPDRADLFAKQGELLLALNRPAEARSSFIHAGKVDDRPEYDLGTAHSLLYEQEYEAAIQIMENIKPRIAPRTEFYDKMILSLGNAYSALGRNEDARTLYREAIAAWPENTAFPYELGETYARERKWERAVETFQALLPRVEEQPVPLGQTLYGLARSLERSGAFDASAQTFERLLSLHPNHADALNYLGYMLAEQGVRLGEAENFIKRALEIDPDNGAYLDSLGWVYYQTGDYRRAQEFLRRAIEQEEAELGKVPDDQPGRRKALRENLAVIYDHAGDCAFATNQFAEARRWWTLALEHDPDIAGTAAKLDDLNQTGSGDGGTGGP